MKYLHAVPVLLVGLCLTGCENRDAETENFGEDTIFGDEPAVHEAVAELEPLDGSSVMGTVSFSKTMDAEAMHLDGEVTGLGEGKHGFHIHEGTSCTQPGDHLNPDNTQHGAPDSTSRHLGDLGNLEAGSDSTASVDIRIDRIELGGENSIVGHVVVVHQGEDDLVTQPSGDSGPPVACGIIESRSEEMQ